MCNSGKLVSCFLRYALVMADIANMMKWRLSNWLLSKHEGLNWAGN